MSPDTSTPKRSPELLEERRLLGIAVHLLGLLTGIVGTGFVYLVTDHEFTRENARNALNWHLWVLFLAIVTFVTTFVGADEIEVAGTKTIGGLPLPGPLDAVLGLLSVVLVFVLIVVSMLTFAFALVATAKAIFGTAWTYPLSPEIVGNRR